MKTIFFIYLFLISIFAFTQNDTINRSDNEGLKQGYWIIKFDNSEQTFEEGKFVDNNKEQVWKQYLINGTLISEITYKNDEPSGYAKMYYSNGQLSEEGIWEQDYWIGNYIAYYKNGTVNYKWHFTDEGLRSGKQQYFYENGKKMISGNWEKGKESGVISRYNEKGELIEKQTFNEGTLNPDLTVKFSPEKKAPVELIVKKDSTVKDTIKQEAIGMFDTTGNTRVLNKKRQLWKEGYFENGKLIKGKIYYYKKDTVYKTDIYKQGKLYKTIKK